VASSCSFRTLASEGSRPKGLKLAAGSVGLGVAQFAVNRGAADAQMPCGLGHIATGLFDGFELGAGQARVHIGGGHLQLIWHPLPPRVIALLRLQRLAGGFQSMGMSI